MKKGFALAFTLIVVSAMIIIASGMSVVLLSGLRVSQVAEGSLQAILASDSGAECALYGDFKNNAFSTSSPQSFVCAGTIVAGEADGTTVFTLPFSSSCAVVTVTKAYVGQILTTTITSQGQNTSDCSQAGTTVVQRGLRIRY